MKNGRIKESNSSAMDGAPKGDFPPLVVALFFSSDLYTLGFFALLFIQVLEPPLVLLVPVLVLVGPS